MASIEKNSFSIAVRILVGVGLVLLLIIDLALFYDLSVFTLWWFVKVPIYLLFWLSTPSLVNQLFFFVKFDVQNKLVRFLTPFGWRVIKRQELQEWSIVKVRGRNPGAVGFSILFIRCITKNNKRFIYPIYKEKTFDVVEVYKDCFGEPTNESVNSKDTFLAQWRALGPSMLLYILMVRVR